MSVSSKELPKTINLVQRFLGDRMSGWNIGTFGALAEFHHVDGEDAEIQYETRGGTVTSKHGALQCHFNGDLRVVAYEGLSARRDAWTHGIAFCLPVHDARMDRRQVLTEIGPDSGAVRDKDRDGVLFDMGVGAEQINFCVRTRDPHLLKTLRQHIGESIIEFDHPAAQTIIRSSPHRVCLSRLGRCEVFQRIPWKPNESSPTGPHTHVLPDLLKHRRSHSANIPIPEGYVVSLHLYPANPNSDTLGNSKEFARGEFDERLIPLTPV